MNIATSLIPAGRTVRPATERQGRRQVRPDRFYVPRSPHVSAGTLAQALRPVTQVEVTGRNVVTCSSASGGAGTSTFAAILARRLAGRSQSVALVDADLATAAGGLDVLLGLEQDRGLRWHGIHAPLGQLNGAALAHQLPRWDGVGVLAFNPWQGDTPAWFEIQAALQALADLHDIVVVDAGRGAMLDQVPALIEASHLVVAQLSVLGLARARTHVEWLERIAQDSVERRTQPPGIGEGPKPVAASAGQVVAVVGAEPLGAVRGKGVVSVQEAREHLGTAVTGPLHPDRTIAADVLEGLGIRKVPRRMARVVDQAAQAVLDAVEQRRQP
ncbi:septum formation initiator [Bifidobacterium cuniculi]|nr:septum formation initiator [Bifidobacterium cuniculi]